MTLHSVYRRVKHYIHEHPWLFPVVQRLRGADYGTFCSSKTDLCIEGYQSSANSFAYNIFRILRPDLDIAHHTHSVANVKRAIMYEVPTLILCRSPAEAIPSMVARFHPSLEGGVYRYRRFYGFVLSKADHLILADFAEITNSFDRTVRRVEKQTGITFGNFNIEEVRKKTIQHIREWSKKHGKEDQISLPKDEREQKKRALRRRLKSMTEFWETEKIYRCLMDALQGEERNIEVSDW